MIFNEHLIWISHIKSLYHTCQSSLDLFHYLFHTTWVADRTILLLYLILVHFKLDYSTHVYCTALPHSLHIQDPVQNEGLCLMSIAFHSSIPSLHILSNILPWISYRIVSCESNFSSLPPSLLPFIFFVGFRGSDQFHPEIYSMFILDCWMWAL